MWKVLTRLQCAKDTHVMAERFIGESSTLLPVSVIHDCYTISEKVLHQHLCAYCYLYCCDGVRQCICGTVSAMVLRSSTRWYMNQYEAAAEWCRGNRRTRRARIRASLLRCHLSYGTAIRLCLLLLLSPVVSIPNLRIYEHNTRTSAVWKTNYTTLFSTFRNDENSCFVFGYPELRIPFRCSCAVPQFLRNGTLPLNRSQPLPYVFFHSS
jgi:hypothetical protein